MEEMICKMSVTGDERMERLQRMMEPLVKASAGGVEGRGFGDLVGGSGSTVKLSTPTKRPFWVMDPRIVDLATCSTLLADNLHHLIDLALFSWLQPHIPKKWCGK
jgi:hypothetical protein